MISFKEQVWNEIFSWEGNMLPIKIVVLTVGMTN